MNNKENLKLKFIKLLLWEKKILLALRLSLLP